MTWPPWTATRTKDSDTRGLQQLTTPLSHLGFKNALLKPFGELRVFLERSYPSSCMALPLTFLCSKLQLFGLCRLTVCWVHELALVTSFQPFLKTSAFLVLSLFSLTSFPVPTRAASPSKWKEVRLFSICPAVYFISVNTHTHTHTQGRCLEKKDRTLPNGYLFLHHGPQSFNVEHSG